KEHRKPCKQGMNGFPRRARSKNLTNLSMTFWNLSAMQSFARLLNILTAKQGDALPLFFCNFTLEIESRLFKTFIVIRDGIGSMGYKVTQLMQLFRFDVLRRPPLALLKSKEKSH
ncbi:MAG TPA: hypothetical protein DCS89_09580, partial [Gammaproteobacteria bacterium]|nr:hypothetical protein [Gammaproteobacteria bacterium]